MRKYRKHVLIILPTAKVKRKQPPGVPFTCIKNFLATKHFSNHYMINHYTFFSFVKERVDTFINFHCRGRNCILVRFC